MSRLLIKVIGLVLLLIGIYYLGQNIIFTSSYYRYFYQNLPALGSVLAIISGVLTVVFFRRETGNLGWILLIIGIVLVFLSGGVFLKPTSLWNFFVSFGTIAVGYKLLNEGRINF
ncbi:MAG: hypothetical protein HC836_07710 [Richelia sp. RM2_1_2]|nr:hypothetical protein [Richelia sp. SM2_1_7]NJM18563.1 hypothetical protein [Richelia sp. SM1_7_0]NJN07359.1 hypothetical protein [Richelia sp. RM1_1_1]NJO29710.1 hypothetical protein [Richelia sp. SL_2_1]NJO58240.1 hypothetical protein [Richelia sp. RM2_1_2]